MVHKYCNQWVFWWNVHECVSTRDSNEYVEKLNSKVNLKPFKEVKVKRTLLILDASLNLSQEHVVLLSSCYTAAISAWEEECLTKII